MFCPKCGAKLEDDSKFCLKCGANLAEFYENSSKPAEPAPKANVSGAGSSSSGTAKPSGSANNTSKIIIAVSCAVIAVAVLIFLAVFVIGPALSNKDDDIIVENETTEQLTTEADTEEPVADVTTEAPATAGGENNASTVTTEAPMTKEDQEAKKEEDEEEADEDSDVDYLIPDSDSRKIKASDYEDFSTQELCYAKNEIYARHGYKFKSKELQKYFGSKDWYKVNKNGNGSISLSAIEQENANKLAAEEKASNHGHLYELDGKAQD